MARPEGLLKTGKNRTLAKYECPSTGTETCGAQNRLASRNWGVTWNLAARMKRSRERQKCKIDWLLIRRADRTLWVASAPQNIGYAMRGLFSRNPKDQFHFHRARWRCGRLIVSPRTFWLARSGEFEMTRGPFQALRLRHWPEQVECVKIDQARSQEQ